jgi:FAD/FMN-containing dehydrogenase
LRGDVCEWTLLERAAALDLHEVSDETIDATLEAMTQATSPMNMVQFRGFGGAMARVSADATAFVHRDKPYQVTLLGLWPDAQEDDAPHRAWVESLWGKVRGDAAGVYVNFVANEGEERIREAYSEATIARLAEVKRKYDPANVFRFNQNIKPAD